MISFSNKLYKLLHKICFGDFQYSIWERVVKINLGNYMQNPWYFYTFDIAQNILYTIYSIKISSLLIGHFFVFVLSQVSFLFGKKNYIDRWYYYTLTKILNHM